MLLPCRSNIMLMIRNSSNNAYNNVTVVPSQPYGAEISSDAFQKFLNERAVAAECLPTVPAATGAAAPPPPSTTDA